MTADPLPFCDPLWTDAELDDTTPDDPRLRDLRGQGLTAVQLHTITDIPLATDHLTERPSTMAHPADEIMNAAQRLRHQYGIVPPHIADPLAKVLESFSALEFDREADIQETDGRHRRMLRLARAINTAEVQP